MNTIRITRSGNKIRVERLEKPDLAGNRLWVTFATLRPGDQIKTRNGWKRVSDCTDAEILSAMKQ